MSSARQPLRRLDGRAEPPRGAKALVIQARFGALRTAPALLVVVALVGAGAAYYFGYYVIPRDAVRHDVPATPGATPTPVATPDGALVNQARTAAVQALGGLVLALGAVLTIRSLRLTREGQITDRLAATVEHLGDERSSVRVAAIHALGRVARDSRTDQGAVMAILGDHLREYCAWPVPEEPPPGAGSPSDGAPYPEVHAVAQVLRERRRGRALEEGSLDFSRIDWRNAPLSGVRLCGVDLSRANLAGAFLKGARLRQANMFQAHLEGASLTRADLRGAHFAHARFDGADCARADFTDATGLTSQQLANAPHDDAKMPLGVD